MQGDKNQRAIPQRISVPMSGGTLRTFILNPSHHGNLDLSSQFSGDGGAPEKS